MRQLVQRFWSRGVWQQLAVMIAVLALSSCSSAATVTTSATATPSRPPTLGAPEANFVAAYGPIVGRPSGVSENFWADKADTIALTVTFSSGTAALVEVVSTDSWTATYTFNYCRAFLPPGASQVDASGQSTIYQSGPSTFLLIVSGSGICAVGFSQQFG